MFECLLADLGMKEDFPWDTSPEELGQEGGSREEGVAALSCEAFLFGHERMPLGR